MKIKKLVYGISAVTLSALMLSACTTAAKSSHSQSSSSKVVSSKKVSTKKASKQVAGATLKDGTYKLEEKNYDHGYKVKMSITVKDGKIVDTTYDQVNKDGKSKTKDAAYEKQMKKVTKTGPKEYIPELEKELKDNGANVAAIQVVSGATETSNNVKNYANQLVQAAQAGDTKTIVIDNGAKLKDGTYKLEDKNYDHGYRQTYEMTVKDGKVTDLKYDQVNKDGKSKTKDVKYEDMMKKGVKVGPKEYIPELTKEFMKSNGDPNKVQVVSGATESSESFILDVSELINAAQAGNTTPIKVDNIVYGD